MSGRNFFGSKFPRKLALQLLSIIVHAIVQASGREPSRSIRAYRRVCSPRFHCLASSSLCNSTEKYPISSERTSLVPHRCTCIPVGTCVHAGMYGVQIARVHKSIDNPAGNRRVFRSVACNGSCSTGNIIAERRINLEIPTGRRSEGSPLITQFVLIKNRPCPRG